MGTDIHIHVEYLRWKKGKKPQWIHADDTFFGNRNYHLFSLLAGWESEVEGLYPLRGIPDNSTFDTEKHYRDYGEEAHSASWLTTQEFGDCLDTVGNILKEEYPDDDTEDWLKHYYHIYRYMKDSDDEGEPARIIFWFDN